MSESSLKLEDLNDPFSPSYAIVQEQMRDLLDIQETAIGNLARANVETLNASRDIFNTTLQSKEDKIEMLQKSIAEDFVPKGRYEELLEKLKREFVPKTDLENLQLHIQDECDKHAETKVALQNIVYQLGESHEKIKSMEEEAMLDKEAFAADCKELKDQLTSAHARNNLLQSQLNEQLMVCEQHQDTISSLSQKVENLQRTQQNQTQKYRQQLRESEVEKQQEAYLQRMMADTGGKSHKKLK